MFVPSLHNQVVFILVLLVQIVQFINIEQINYATFIISVKALDTLSAKVYFMVRTKEVFLLFGMEVTGGGVVVL
jgi:hypothetical protein